jgi:hypothetical protein
VSGNFTNVVVGDFEYEVTGGDLPNVLCMVAHVLNENLQHVRTIRTWRGEFGSTPPFDIGPDTISVLNKPVAGVYSPEMAQHLSAPEAAKPVRGRPFERGQSGNPGGQPSLFKVYAAEFGDMTPVECTELRRAISLIRRAQRADDNNAVRMYREAREWLAGIRARRASKAAPIGSDLDAYLAHKGAAAS